MKIILLAISLVTLLSIKISADELIGGGKELTIKEFAIWNGGELWIRFANEPGRLEWDDGYFFSAIHNTTDGKKAMIALIVSAITNGKQVIARKVGNTEDGKVITVLRVVN